jgi:hypothetical protein
MLNAGVHQVELRFVPPLWRLGWVLVGVTVVGLLIWQARSAIVGARQSRSVHQPGS